MFDVKEAFARLTLYLDHLDMNLSEYLSQPITYNMDDLVSKKIGPPKKRYCNDFFVDKMVDWAEMEVETEGVEARTSTTDGVEARNSTTEGVKARTSNKDKGKERASEDASDVVETRRCTIEVDFETEYESDVDSDYQSDKPVEYLSPAIRGIVLERMNKMREISRKWNPRHVIHAGGNLFKVRSGSEGFTIDEGKSTCSCRMWQFLGLSCVHAPKKMLGWPRKKRIRAIGEGGSSTRVSKVCSQGSCSNCKKPGHNKSRCKEPVVEQTPKPKGVVGRHRKKKLVDDFEDVDVVQRGPMMDEGASETREGRGADGSGGASGSRGRGTARSRGGASGSIGRGAGGSKMKPVSIAGTQKRQGKKKVETSGFAEWFGLQDEPE
nr:multidrug resistance-associated protein 5 [Tanacetum cinerariifolium]